MEKANAQKMRCDRIEEGRFCILVNREGNCLSLPLDTLSPVPIAGEYYRVITDMQGNYLLTHDPNEKKKQLARIRQNRKSIIRTPKKQ